MSWFSRLLSAVLSFFGRSKSVPAIEQKASTTSDAPKPSTVTQEAPPTSKVAAQPAQPSKRGLSRQQCEERYGKIENGKWLDESKWMCIFEVPDDVAPNWINSANNQPTRKIYINKDLVVPLTQALTNLKERRRLHELKTFDGCFMIRMVRGSTSDPSTHSYALALDLNAKENPLGGPVNLTPEFVQCFKDAGFDWGGDFKRKDGMHFSFAWEGMHS